MKEVNSELVDEIVDEILKSRDVENYGGKGSGSNEILKLKNRTASLEDRLNKYINNFKTVAVEVERELTEKWEELNRENERQTIELQGQIEDLRTALIRLSNEMKNIKESIGQK